MRQVTILALDLGTTTGYAIGGEAIQSGTMRWAKRGAAEDAGARFRRFSAWLRETITENGVSRVVYEDVRRHNATVAAHIYGGFKYALAAICGELGVEYEGVGVGVIKKHATERGNASKLEMLAAANARGWQPADDNEADALWLLDYVLQEVTA